MGFDVYVLAIDDWADPAEVAAMVERCNALVHVEGEIDPRIAGFYEGLQADFPDDSAAGDQPWKAPLGAGIDHVWMSVGSAPNVEAALDRVAELAVEHGLTMFYPMDGTAQRMIPGPERAKVDAWWRALRDGRAGFDETFERVQPWIEETPGAVRDPITWLGLQVLYHGDGTGYEQWLAEAERHDADPEGWKRAQEAG
ncbi:hypothetical protein [Actinoplanes sp. RD1]|uniref:hypothetical protein n=1 Tax=Actinoplanes sp. RD1 TaxID=3064538 RepID=UPI0027427B4F|nr:hypothetical protein [Actinoplanes sp. RD1]